MAIRWPALKSVHGVAMFSVKFTSMMNIVNDISFYVNTDNRYPCSDLDVDVIGHHVQVLRSGVI